MGAWRPAPARRRPAPRHHLSLPIHCTLPTHHSLSMKLSRYTTMDCAIVAHTVRAAGRRGRAGRRERDVDDEVGRPQGKGGEGGGAAGHARAAQTARRACAPQRRLQSPGRAVDSGLGRRGVGSAAAHAPRVARAAGRAGSGGPEHRPPALALAHNPARLGAAALPLRQEATPSPPRPRAAGRPASAPPRPATPCAVPPGPHRQSRLQRPPVPPNPVAGPAWSTSIASPSRVASSLRVWARSPAHSARAARCPGLPPSRPPPPRPRAPPCTPTLRARP